MRPDALRVHRAELIDAYAKARRQHRARRCTADRLHEATTALLKAEVQQYRPRRGRPPNPRPVHADLFVNEARP